MALNPDFTSLLGSIFFAGLLIHSALHNYYWHWYFKLKLMKIWFLCLYRPLKLGDDENKNSFDLSLVSKSQLLTSPRIQWKLTVFGIYVFIRAWKSFSWYFEEEWWVIRMAYWIGKINILNYVGAFEGVGFVGFFFLLGGFRLYLVVGFFGAFFCVLWDFGIFFFFRLNMLCMVWIERVVVAGFK